MRSATILAGLAAAIVIGNAPAIIDQEFTASASPDDLTNQDVASQHQTRDSLVFVPEKIILPEPASGGQGPFNHYNPDGTVRFDDGISESTRAMLDAMPDLP